MSLKIAIMKKNLREGKKKPLIHLSPIGHYSVNLHIHRLQIASFFEVLHTDKNNHFKN